MIQLTSTMLSAFIVVLVCTNFVFGDEKVMEEEQFSMEGRTTSEEESISEENIDFLGKDFSMEESTPDEKSSSEEDFSKNFTNDVNCTEIKLTNNSTSLDAKSCT
ncbi:unnamed protein product [Wuchereria bancrofti]|uniref:Uncharacterized protein n=2 Tax=Wuchereria bancrofti TaxID=6293 RepID=A0A3P7FG97_WUCBA|nr:unnamed protein product [Wuchereria bancrofti]